VEKGQQPLWKARFYPYIRADHILSFCFGVHILRQIIYVWRFHPPAEERPPTSPLHFSVFPPLAPRPLDLVIKFGPAFSESKLSFRSKFWQDQIQKPLRTINRLRDIKHHGTYSNEQSEELQAQ